MTRDLVAACHETMRHGFDLLGAHLSSGAIADFGAVHAAASGHEFFAVADALAPGAVEPSEVVICGDLAVAEGSVVVGAPEGDVRAVYVVEGYGDTRVERPPGTRNLPVNLLSDLLR